MNGCHQTVAVCATLMKHSSKSHKLNGECLLSRNMLEEPRLLNQSQKSSRGAQATATPQQLPLVQAISLIGTPTLLSPLATEYLFSVYPRAVTLTTFPTENTSDKTSLLSIHGNRGLLVAELLCSDRGCCVHTRPLLVDLNTCILSC